ncbi:MAG TPA: hypothetical protein VFC63_17855 [Blastocatellia bacterium]|nr:hypothetical protein [Blastocatellia bacterium]
MGTANTINQHTSNPPNVANKANENTITPTNGKSTDGHGLTGTIGNALNQTKHLVADGYTKTTEFLGNTAEGAINLGKKNPGKTALITFGLGIGAGMLLMKALTPKPRSRFWLW